MIDNPRTFPEISYYKQAGTSPVEIWYPASMVVSPTLSGASFTTGVLRAIPFMSGKGMNIDIIALEVTTLGASAKVRCGIYESTSDTNNFPSKLVVDSGEFDASSTGVKQASISTVLKPNRIYWTAVLGGTASCSMRANTGASGNGTPCIGFPTSYGSGASTGISVAQSYGSLPSTFPATTTFITNTPLVFIRLSS